MTLKSGQPSETGENSKATEDSSSKRDHTGI